MLQHGEREKYNSVHKIECCRDNSSGVPGSKILAFQNKK